MGRSLLLATLLSMLPLALSCQPFRGADQIQVISISRAVDKSRSDHAMCASLAMTRANVVSYFLLADEVAPTEFHAEAMIMPCSYRGSIRISGHRYRWQIFAGGAGYLYDGVAANKRYLCRKKCLDALPDLQ